MNVIDLFCGAGGLSEGFKQAGFNIVLGVDNDPVALETFRKNHSNSEILCKDILKLSKEDVWKKIGYQNIELIIGGPPCQGFSLARKRDPKDQRNELIKYFLKIVFEIKPKMFLIENVSGLLSMRNHKGKNIIEEIMNLTKKEGYFIKKFLLNAEEYGVPQKRKRVFLVGSLFEELNLKIKKQKKKGVSEILLKKEEVPRVYFLSKKSINGFKRRERENRKKGRGYGWQFLDLKDTSYTISARYYKDGAEALIKYSEEEIRMLTPKECAFIQSFPEDYQFEGGKVKTYKQIGNAVPPQLSLKIARAIKEEIKNGH